MDSLSAFVSPNAIITIIVIALSNVAIITSIKQALRKGGKTGIRIMNNGMVKFTLEIAQPVMGAGFAAIPGVFNDDTLSFPLQLMCGTIAGFLSPTIYRKFLKRFMPNVAVPPSHPSRQPHGIDDEDDEPMDSGGSIHSTPDALPPRKVKRDEVE